MVGIIRQEIERALASRQFLSIGVVTAVEWKQQLARVRIVTTGQETNWLRVGAGFAGEVHPLRNGDEVLVCFPAGNPAGQGFVLHRLYGAAAPPGLPENCWGAKQGSRSVLFGADGKVAMEVAQFDVSATGPASIDGSHVNVGGSAAAAVRYEQLDAALQAWLTSAAAALSLYLLTNYTPLPTPPTPKPPVVLPPFVIAPSRSLKVSLT